MKWPTIEQVNEAGIDQLSIWFWELEIPTNEIEFESLRPVWEEIKRRVHEVGLKPRRK